MTCSFNGSSPARLSASLPLARCVKKPNLQRMSWNKDKKRNKLRTNWKPRNSVCGQHQKVLIRKSWRIISRSRKNKITNHLQTTPPRQRIRWRETRHRKEKNWNNWSYAFTHTYKKCHSFFEWHFYFYRSDILFVSG